MADITQRSAEYREVFSSDAGKRVLSDLMKKHKFFGQVTVGFDPISTAYNDGQRSVVIGILREIEANEDELERFFRILPPTPYGRPNSTNTLDPNTVNPDPNSITVTGHLSDTAFTGSV